MTGRRFAGAATAVLLVLLVLLTATPAAAAPVPTPTAPRPTSTAASPEAPDPHPPAGGDGPAGVVPGGSRMAERGLVLPHGAATLTRPTATAWVLADLTHGTVLAAQDPHGRYQPASILKTLTALVLLPRLTGPTRIPISQTAADTEGSAVGLVPGGSYTADDLFRAMLLMSGNDATEALVGAAGGDAAVVDAMNTTVRGLGGYDTVAQTPTGLDGWSQLTSAYDLAIVLCSAVRDIRLMHYDQAPRWLLPAQSVLKNGQRVGTIEMDNQSSDYLDGYPGAIFAKTGYTDAARHTFLAAAQRGGITLGVVMLRAERTPVDQWQQAAALMDWGFRRPHTAVAAVGTLDDATELATKAATAATASPTAPATSTSTSDPATPTASPDGVVPGDLAAARTATGTGPHVPVAPLVYAGVVVLFVLALLGLDRRRRRRR